MAVAQKLPHQIELYDRLIVATAVALNVPLITKDEALRKITAMQAIW